MAIAGFIYARTDSTRLPNKIFKRFGQRSLIDIILDRLKYCNIDSIYLLTSERALDDPISMYCEQQGIDVFRGCYNDVVLRTVQAINSLPVTKFLRVNGDSPFISPTLINYCLRYSENKKFTSNLFERTFPYGVALEIVESHWFCQNAKLRINNNKEHITSHLYQNIFPKDALSVTQNQNWHNHKLTIDTPEDYDRLHNVLSENHLIEYWEFLKCRKPTFRISEKNA